ncbi:ER membrane protein complex subunit 6 isoform X4 [Gopherus evgoodei]|nr:ER membrane protein complex subunit 6 isoform X3 [Gopherus evgoodei]XP_030392332.1 ER membrane protein complex subunit 6 isoform X4 [Gopherus evgoodei]
MGLRSDVVLGPASFSGQTEPDGAASGVSFGRPPSRPGPRGGERKATVGVQTAWPILHHLCSSCILPQGMDNVLMTDGLHMLSGLTLPKCATDYR